MGAVPEEDVFGAPHLVEVLLLAERLLGALDAGPQVGPGLVRWQIDVGARNRVEAVLGSGEAHGVAGRAPRIVQASRPSAPGFDRLAIEAEGVEDVPQGVATVDAGRVLDFQPRTPTGVQRVEGSTERQVPILPVTVVAPVHLQTAVATEEVIVDEGELRLGAVDVAVASQRYVAARAEEVRVAHRQVGLVGAAAAADPETENHGPVVAGRHSDVHLLRSALGLVNRYRPHLGIVEVVVAPEVALGLGKRLGVERLSRSKEKLTTDEGNPGRSMEPVEEAEDPAVLARDVAVEDVDVAHQDLADPRPGGRGFRGGTLRGVVGSAGGVGTARRLGAQHRRQQDQAGMSEEQTTHRLREPAWGLMAVPADRFDLQATSRL